MKLEDLNNCINDKLYEMYQDIPSKELDFVNNIKGCSKEQFINICNEYITSETKIKTNINTTTKRYILIDNNDYIGYWYKNNFK